MRFSAIFLIAILPDGLGLVNANSEQTRSGRSFSHTFEMTPSELRQIAIKHNLQNHEDKQDKAPLFEHHVELMYAIATKQIHFDAMSVNFSAEYGRQLINDEVDKRSIRVVNGSFSLFGGNKYVSLDLNHESTRIFDVGSHHVIHCNREIVESSIGQGDFIVGSQDGGWLKSPDSKSWKIHKQTDTGLLITRRAVAVRKIASTDDHGNCHHIETENIHPMELIQQAKVFVQYIPPELYEYHLPVRNSSSSRRGLRGEMSNEFIPDYPLLACSNNAFSDTPNYFYYSGPYSDGKYYIVFGDATGCISIDYSLNVFNFNYDGTAAINPRIALGGTNVKGIDCVNCYFYLGGSIQAIFEYFWVSTGFLTGYYAFYMEAKIKGGVGFNAQIQIVNPSVWGSTVIQIISASSNSAYNSLNIYSGIVLYFKPGGLKATISGSGSAIGSVYMGAGFSASASLGVIFDGSSVSLLPSYSFSYTTPYFTVQPGGFTVVSCSLEVQFIATENFKLAFGTGVAIGGLFDMSIMDGVKYASSGALQTSISIDIDGSSPVWTAPIATATSKNGIQQSTIGIYTPGSTIIMDVSYTLFEFGEKHELFFTMEKIDEASNILEALPILQTTFLSNGNGTETVKWRIPWDVRFFGSSGSTTGSSSVLNLWKISVHSSNLMSRLMESSPFVLTTITTVETSTTTSAVSLVLKPQANEIVNSDTFYDIIWDESLLCTFLEEAGTGGHGIMTTVEKVVIEVQVGVSTGAGGGLPFTNSTLNRWNLTSLEGVLNSGRATVVFPGSLLKHGKEFSVVIRSTCYSNLFGWSMGVFSINNGSSVVNTASPVKNVTYGDYPISQLSEKILSMQSTGQYQSLILTEENKNNLLATTTCPGTRNLGILAYDARYGNQIKGISISVSVPFLPTASYTLAASQPTVSEYTIIPSSDAYTCLVADTNKPTIRPTAMPITKTPTIRPTAMPITKTPTISPTAMPNVNKPSGSPTAMPNVNTSPGSPTAMPNVNTPPGSPTAMPNVNTPPGSPTAMPNVNTNTNTDSSKSSSGADVTIIIVAVVVSVGIVVFLLVAFLLWRYCGGSQGRVQPN
eukprot:gene4632-9193_t